MKGEVKKDIETLTDSENHNRRSEGRDKRSDYGETPRRTRYTKPRNIFKIRNTANSRNRKKQDIE